MTSAVMEGLGYDTKTSILGLNVILEAMKNGDIDVLMGYWEPAMDPYIDSYLEEGSIENLAVNLTGAKYTYAVPQYVYDAGVKTFDDIARFPREFKRELYGIEPGSNTLILEAIDEGRYGLAGWEVVESSEQGMLAQVDRAIKRGKWIAFHGWEPHPMNTKYEMAYLAGGDAIFGPDFGGATVHTTARRGFSDRCANAGRLLGNIRFSLALENKGMGLILDDKLNPEEAARVMLRENDALLDVWLDGVTTVDGQDGLIAVRRYLLKE